MIGKRTGTGEQPNPDDPYVAKGGIDQLRLALLTPSELSPAQNGEEVSVAPGRAGGPS